MLTKQEVVEMLANSKYILSFEKNKEDILEKINKEEFSIDDMMIIKVLSKEIFLKMFNEYEKIIQHILFKLDEIDTPTETTS